MDQSNGRGFGYNLCVLTVGVSLAPMLMATGHEGAVGVEFSQSHLVTFHGFMIHLDCTRTRAWDPESLAGCRTEILIRRKSIMT